MANANGSNGKKTGAQLSREIDEVLAMRQKKQGKAAPAAPSRSGTPSQADYEHRELDDANRRLRDVERASLADRKEAAAQFFEAMRDSPELVAERLGWLLDGSYGYGEGVLAKRILGSPRMNRSAALTQMVAALEWSSPSAMTRASWKKLTKAQQAALEKAVQAAIRDAESEE